jgi:hypothetical protein
MRLNSKISGLLCVLTITVAAPARSWAAAAAEQTFQGQVESPFDPSFDEPYLQPFSSPQVLEYEPYFSKPSAGQYALTIKSLAGSSSCAAYSWKNRGRAPVGYIKGVALSFARSLCRLKTSAPHTDAAVIMSAGDTHNDKKDALTHYHTVLSSLQMATSTSGEDTLRSVYTLGIGLGMRESSGGYCVGWDTSAGSHRPSSAAEAGAFQVSYDSIGASADLKKLYDEYRASTQRCQLNTFKEGASCSSQSILGSGAGAVFQAFNKACPAFATEYAITLLRVLRSHFGPINRLEAEVKPACNVMLKDVQTLVDADPVVACQELY